MARRVYREVFPMTHAARDGEKMLISTELKGDARLQRAARNSPPLQFGEGDPAVARLWYWLFVFGHVNPALRTSPMAAIYGNDMRDAVLSFQHSLGLTEDGTAGRQTLLCLDALLVAKAHDLPPTKGVGPWGPFTDRRAISWPGAARR